MKHRAPTELDRTCRDSFYKHIAPTALVPQNALTPTPPYSHTPILPHFPRPISPNKLTNASM
jgi:hypothetical protein